MCGITGVAFHEMDPARFAEMNDRLAHRGPDQSGFWHHAGDYVYLGHRRLSILDLSHAGDQPMQDASGRWVLTFNGEIYNFADLKHELEGRGFSFYSHSDTEVLVNAIATWGVEATLRKLNGMFAFAVWDQLEKVLYLARDRFGEKPLYYGAIGSAFVFASELKPIFHFPGYRPEIDPQALGGFLALSYVAAPGTIIKGINKLEPGCFLRVTGANKWIAGTYWDPQLVAEQARKQPFQGSEADAVAALKDQLLQSVRLRSISDVPLGCFLSGGIDSSLITAMMCQISEQPVKTFSMGFEIDAFNEAEVARKVAEHLGTNHFEQIVTERDALDVIPHLPEMFDEPFGDSSQIPTHLVSKMARENVTVSLSGDAGDELFGGYTRYIQAPLQYARLKKFPSAVRSSMARMMSALPPSMWDSLYRKSKWLLPETYNVQHFGEKLQKLSRATRSAQSELSFYNSLIQQAEHPESFLCLEGSFDPKGNWNSSQNMAENMMLNDVRGYLPGDILTKVDRASMAVSLEARVPFLDPGLFEFAWSLPMHLKIRGGKGKWILRELLGELVPASCFERPKSGFALPIAHWLRGSLRDWAEDLLEPDHPHALLDSKRVGRCWREHLKGRRDHNAILWNILMFRAWENRWIRGK